MSDNMSTPEDQQDEDRDFVLVDFSSGTGCVQATAVHSAERLIKEIDAMKARASMRDIRRKAQLQAEVEQADSPQRPRTTHSHMNTTTALASAVNTPIYIHDLVETPGGSVAGKGTAKAKGEVETEESEYYTDGEDVAFQKARREARRRAVDGAERRKGEGDWAYVPAGRFRGHEQRLAKDTATATTTAAAARARDDLPTSKTFPNFESDQQKSRHLYQDDNHENSSSISIDPLNVRQDPRKLQHLSSEGMTERRKVDNTNFENPLPSRGDSPSPHTDPDVKTSDKSSSPSSDGWSTDVHLGSDIQDIERLSEIQMILPMSGTALYPWDHAGEGTDDAKTEVDAQEIEEKVECEAEGEQEGAKDWQRARGFDDAVIAGMAVSILCTVIWGFQHYSVLRED